MQLDYSRNLDIKTVRGIRSLPPVVVTPADPPFGGPF
jgi:hypothetical protein